MAAGADGVHGGIPESCIGSDGGLEVVASLIGGRSGWPNECGGGFEEDAGGFAGRPSCDGAAGWVRRVGGDGGVGHGAGVGPDRVAVKLRQDDGVVSCDGVEIGGGGEDGLRPVVHVVPSAKNALAGRALHSGVTDLLKALGLRGCGGEIEDGRGLADAVEMTVAVHQAGDDGSAVEVDLLGGVLCGGADLVETADGGDAPVADEHGLADGYGVGRARVEWGVVEVGVME